MVVLGKGLYSSRFPPFNWVSRACGICLPVWSILFVAFFAVWYIYIHDQQEREDLHCERELSRKKILDTYGRAFGIRDSEALIKCRTQVGTRWPSQTEPSHSPTWCGSPLQKQWVRESCLRGRAHPDSGAGRSGPSNRSVTYPAIITPNNASPLFRQRLKYNFHWAVRQKETEWL